MLPTANNSSRLSPIRGASEKPVNQLFQFSMIYNYISFFQDLKCVDDLLGEVRRLVNKVKKDIAELKPEREAGIPAFLIQYDLKLYTSFFQDLKSANDLQGEVCRLVHKVKRYRRIEARVTSRYSSFIIQHY